MSSGRTTPFRRDWLTPLPFGPRTAPGRCERRSLRQLSLHPWWADVTGRSDARHLAFLRPRCRGFWGAARTFGRYPRLAHGGPTDGRPRAGAAPPAVPSRAAGSALTPGPRLGQIPGG